METALHTTPASNNPGTYSFFLNGNLPEQDELVSLALEDFRDKSGLSAEILERAQVRIFSGNGDLLKERLGFASLGGQPILKTALLVEIPEYGPDGTILDYHYRLYPPVNGIRYLHGEGRPARPYILPGVWAFKDKTHKPLWLTEGAKKGLKLIQHGRHVISLAGVWNFRDGNGAETFLFDDLEQFTWKGRTVYLAFDLDLWTNPQVRFALYELALKLMARGAIARFPRWTGGKGIDDHLVGQKDPEKVLDEIEDRAVMFDAFVLPDHKDELVRALKCARAGFDPLTWESLIGRIAKRLGVRAKTLLTVLDQGTTIVTDTGIVIANPSYEINQTFMSLGFKETVLVDNEPRERNLFTIATGAGLVLHDSATFALGDEKIVFNVRERVLMSLSDRWSKTRLTAFVKEPASPEGIYREIEAVLRRYIEVQNEAHYGLIATWIIATYFHRCFNAFPFLFFYGKKQSGKSRALDLLERLCFNAIKVKGVSVPSLADSIDAVRATFLMDQAEILSDKRNVELLGILADSYTVGGGKRRVISITNKSRRVLEFETYSPKTFASINEIDQDLKDRCIELNMVRAEREYPYPEAFLPIWPDLRDRLYRLLLTRWREVREIYQTAGQGVKARVRELWRPLDTILIIEKVSEDDKAAIREAFLESMMETQAGLTDLEVVLFEAIKSLLGRSGEGTFTVSELVDKMALPDSADFSRSKQTKWVGRTLHKLTLFTKREGRIRNQHSYLFTLEHIENIFNRYQTNGINGTSAESANDNGSQSADLKSTSAKDGTRTAGDMPTNADAADSRRPHILNGSPGSPESQQDCRYADRAVEYAADENILPSAEDAEDNLLEVVVLT